MPDAPSPSLSRSLRLVRSAAPRLAAFGIAVAFIIALGWGTSVIAASRADERPAPAADAEPFAVLDRGDPAVTALAGARRDASAASEGLRSAGIALAGHTDAGVLAEVSTALATLDQAAGDDDHAAVVEATAAFRSARPSFIERIAAEADARIASAGSADAAVAQAARDAVAAVRGAAEHEASGRFAPMRAAVEAVLADHAAVEAARAAAEAEADEDDEWSGGSSGGSGAGPTIPAPAPNPCAPPSLISDDEDERPCEPDVVVTALGSYVASCPAGTFGKMTDFLGPRSGNVTLSYSYQYTYDIQFRHRIAVFSCDPF